MTQDNEEPSAASAGSPGLAVWCCIYFSKTQERLDADFRGELWVKMKMPSVLPVGSQVDLPTPRGWYAISGMMEGRVREWRQHGTVLVCEMDHECHIDFEATRELVSIGYIDAGDGYPSEVLNAYEALLV